MIFAQDPDDLGFLKLLLALSPLLFILAVWQNLKGFRRLRSEAERDQSEVFRGTSASDQVEKGKVLVAFHTYYGFLVYVTQTKHRFWAAPEEARTILWKLHCFNCTRGMFAYGAFLIPLVSCLNYLAQKRSIRKQESNAKALRPTSSMDGVDELL